MDIRKTGSAICILRAYYLTDSTRKQYNEMSTQLETIIAMCKSAEKRQGGLEPNAETVSDNGLSTPRE